MTEFDGREVDPKKQKCKQTDAKYFKSKKSWKKHVEKTSKYHMLSTHFFGSIIFVVTKNHNLVYS